MPLSAQDLDRLKAAVSRYQARVAVFPAYTITLDTSKLPAANGSTSYTINPRPMPMIAPRRATVANSGSITLSAAQSYRRGNVLLAAGNIAWALEAGSAGSLVDNGDMTATYTAPASTNGVAQINMTATYGGQSKVAYAFVHYDKSQYDSVVAEIATLSGSISQHGWKCVMRCRGDASAFTLDKGVLFHVEDLWSTTAGTFDATSVGGFQYAEGVFYGIITDRQAFVDGAGISWIGLELLSPWYLLELTRVGETWWGYTADNGKLRLVNFAPNDAVWHFTNEITNFSQYHDVVCFTDNNIVDDLIIEESDLATIFEDVAERTMCIAYCDRYGSLFAAAPSPDVRADEFPLSETSIYAVTDDLVLDYTIHEKRGTVKKLLIEAVDASMKGIYAISDNASAVTGRNERIGKLICDRALTLASWAVQKRAELNRPWYVDISQPLNHALDIGDFVDVILTAPPLSGSPTGSAQCWVYSIAHRPDLAAGTWEGRTQLLPRTDALGGTEVGAVSSWGGTGQFTTGRAPYSGSSRRGSGSGGWRNNSGGQLDWCHMFNFAAVSSGNWSAFRGSAYESGSAGSYNAGWSGAVVFDAQSPWLDLSAATIWIQRDLGINTTVTRFSAWLLLETATNVSWASYLEYDSSASSRVMLTSVLGTGATAVGWSGSLRTTRLYIGNESEAPIGSGHFAAVIKSAMVCGLGADPFEGGTGNAPQPI